MTAPDIYYRGVISFFNGEPEAGVVLLLLVLDPGYIRVFLNR